ncbi:MAG: ATP-dependent DNA helicase RecG [Clostridiales Family XIII bacterium]|nr:ATP-dependent DNA helicase RecG [Clostridiales Family XIII bacterium]
MRLALDAPVTVVSGIGAVKKKALEKMRVFTVGDLVSHFPRDYEDRRRITKIAEAVPNSAVQIRGVVSSVTGRPFGRREGRAVAPLRLSVEDDSGSIEVVFFNLFCRSNTFSPGEEYVFYGRTQSYGSRVQILNPEYSRPGEGAVGRILPIYPLTDGISQKDMRKWIGSLLFSEECAAPLIEEHLPEQTINRNKLRDIGHAFRNLHFPTDERMFREARYRLVFDELLTLQAGLLLLKNSRRELKGVAFNADVDMSTFLTALPYELTRAQKRVWTEVSADMESSRAMNRLLQGDVGSGKTIIAAAAMYKAARSGYQSVIMAPTETLAKQHYHELRGLFEGLGIETGLLSGGIRGTERAALLERLENGLMQVAVGTHALIQPDVKYHRLGLAVTDEQHRFGVEQRVELTRKGENPDILVMTATPIPRTLAFTLYGDMDISIIDEKPPGRQAVLTRHIDSRYRSRAYEFVKKEARGGRQIYVVAPTIEATEESEIKSAKSVFAEIDALFDGLKIALLHGKMKPAEKESIMDDFYARKIDVLVSTVLIEVGINVPNASVMLIENAERFGLAQLHQLRGRVGRGTEQSYCVLITDGKSEEIKERMDVMVSTEDGFKIAEKDLELRGPGEFFGVRQHGVPPLKIASFIKHLKVLEAVREEAAKLLEDDPQLVKIQNRAFRERIESFFADGGEVAL